MSQAQSNDEHCQHCKQQILSGQPIVKLHKATFHASCLTAWCQAQLKKRSDLADALRNPV